MTRIEGETEYLASFLLMSTRAPEPPIGFAMPGCFPSILRLPGDKPRLLIT